MNKKVVLITGASSGIGKATALKLIDEGYMVYAAARNIKNMQDILQKGGKIFSLDVTKEDQVKAFVDYVLDKETRIDVLFNNAGFGLYGAVEDVSMQDAKYQFDVNLFGLASMTKAVLPIMRNQKAGLIINTSGMAGRVYTPFGSWYHASKYALEGFSDCLRLEVESFGIKVVLLEPGMIATNFFNVLNDNVEKYIDQSPYESSYKSMLKSFSVDELKTNGTDVSVIANLVSKIIKKKNPKYRYLKGYMSKTAVFGKAVLKDRIYSKIVKKRMGV